MHLYNSMATSHMFGEQKLNYKLANRFRLPVCTYVCIARLHLLGVHSYGSPRHYDCTLSGCSRLQCTELRQSRFFQFLYRTPVSASRQLHLCITSSGAPISTITSTEHACTHALIMQQCCCLLARENPSCPQTTAASKLSQLSSQIVPN